MFLKDRYSYAFMVLLIGFSLSIVFLRKDKGLPAAITFIAATLYSAYLFTRSGRLHLTPLQKEQQTAALPSGSVYFKSSSGIKLKSENGCGFTGKLQTNIDGIQINGKRYKVVNGADVYINPNNHPVPCGFGSAIMQAIGQGGYEPPAIQNDACWN